MQVNAMPVLLISAYLLVDGISAFFAGVNVHSASKRGRLLIADGVFRVVLLLPLVLFGFTFPFGIFALALIVAGIIEIVAAVRLRKHLNGSLFFGLSGAVSILFFPFLIFIAALGGQPNFIATTGAYMVVFGALILAFGFRMRGSVRQAK